MVGFRDAYLCTAITSVPVYCLILFCLPETLRSLVGDGAVHAERSWILVPQLRQARVVDSNKYPRMPRPTPKAFYRLLKYPPNLIVTVSGALLFAVFYAILISFPRVLEGIYGFSEAEVGYAYLCPGTPSMARRDILLSAHYWPQFYSMPRKLRSRLPAWHILVYRWKDLADVL